MKKFSILALLIILLFPLFSKVSVPKLFDITEELDKFPVMETEKGDEERYSSIEFYLVTGGPGSLVWENFGHTAILMTSSSSPIAFDWGIFTFDDSFFVNFAFGRLYYEAWATYGEYRIRSLESDDRSVSITKLELDTKEKKNLYAFLFYATKDENRTYLYDYFSDNCATRPRDIYSWLTGGDFEEKLRNTPNDETLRETVERHLSLSSFPVCWSISYLLGPSTDKPSSAWDACFLPSRLEEEIEKYQGKESVSYYDSQERKGVPEKWSLKLRSLLMGLVLAAIPLTFLSRRRWLERTGDTILALVHLYFGIISSVLIFLSLFTIHSVTKGNINSLVISPLCLVAAFLHFASLGKRRKTKALKRVSAIMAGLTVITVPMALFIGQDITSFILPAILLFSSELVSSILLDKRK